MKIVAIEANVGAGKTTLLEPLRVALERMTGEKWELCIEPVDEDPEFHRLLKEALSNPTDADKRIEFQKYITSMRQNLHKSLPDGNYVIERSLFSDLVFSQCLMLQTERPDAAFMDYYYNIKEKLMDYPRIDAVVYLDREPYACQQSIKERGREGEHYEMHQLLDLKRFHDACLPQIARQYDTPLVTIDIGYGFADPYKVAYNIIATLEDE